LSQGERHGYAIMQEIEGRTGGAFKIGAGTLYRSIKKLVDAGFIAEVTPEVPVHQQRRTYRLMPSGRERAAAEARVFDGSRARLLARELPSRTKGGQGRPNAVAAERIAPAAPEPKS